MRRLSVDRFHQEIRCQPSYVSSPWTILVPAGIYEFAYSCGYQYCPLAADVAGLTADLLMEPNRIYRTEQELAAGAAAGVIEESPCSISDYSCFALQPAPLVTAPGEARVKCPLCGARYPVIPGVCRRAPFSKLRNLIHPSSCKQWSTLLASM